jgi:IclR family KDG regulon transcriptional repressor
MDDNIIQSIHRANQILGLFSLSDPYLGISEISRLLNLKKGTTQGLVRTLTRDGFLEQDGDTRKYRLGLRIYELGTILAGSLEINQKASGPAYQLAKKTQRLVRVAMMDRDSALVTLDAFPESQPFYSPQFGPRAPLYCTALGKAMLGFLDREEINGYLKRVKLTPYNSNTIVQKNRLLEDLKETRKKGYSINREEHMLGRAAIGAPIFGRKGYPVGSIVIIVDPNQLDEMIKSLGQEVIKTALEISRLMGYSYKSILPQKDYRNVTR